MEALAGENPHEKKNLGVALRVSCAKTSGSTGPSGTYLEALQGRLLKFGDHSRKICVNEKYVVDCLAQEKPPWAAYWAFTSGCLLALDKLPGLRLVGVGETWFHLFAKCVLKVTGYDATHTCRDDQICSVLKEGIDGTINGVQYILEDNLTEKNWVFKLVDANNAFNEINRI